MKHILCILFTLLLISASMSAQTSVSGSVVDKEGEALAGSTILFLQSDTIAGGTVTDSKGKFELKGLPAGEYECTVSMIGFKPENQKFNLTGKVKLPQFVLEEDATALDEVTVSAGMRSKELAGMSIYYLSDRAKNMRSVFDALGEIPVLIVDPINRSIQLEDLRYPLVLVNGVRKPLSAVDPGLIQSVEIIDNPSARYRGDESVTAVLNINLKKQGIQPYLRGGLGIITQLNLNNTFYHGEIETGTSTSSFYAEATYSLDNKTINGNYSDITQGMLHREEAGKSRNYRNSLEAKIGGDKEFSKKDYFAYRFDYVGSKSISHYSGEGIVTDMETGQESPLLTSSYSKTPFHSFAGNLYYKHSFASQRTLEFDGRYDFSKNSSIASRKASSEIYSYVSDIDLYNTRHSGNLNINYSDMLTKSLHFEAGSKTEYSITNIDDIADELPLFRYQRTHEYLYAGIDNNRSKSRFNYVVSLGLDMVFTSAAGIRHNYIDFVPSVSMAYKISSKQNLKFSYNRTRTLPQTTSLNPYNTSTDSLKMVVGNPYLEPAHNNTFRLDYVLNAGIFRIAPYLQYIYRTDLIQPKGYMDNDIYVSTYQNYGHGEVIQSGLALNLKMPCGFISAAPYYSRTYLKGMPFSGNNFGLNINGSVNYKNIAVGGYFVFPSRSYSLYGKTTGIMNSRVHFQWMPSMSWAFTFTAEKFLFPHSHSKSITINGDYRAFTSSAQLNQAPMFSVGVWYMFVTKNFKWRNKKTFSAGNNELENIQAN